METAQRPLKHRRRLEKMILKYFKGQEAVEVSRLGSSATCVWTSESQLEAGRSGEEWSRSPIRIQRPCVLVSIANIY